MALLAVVMVVMDSPEAFYDALWFTDTGLNSDMLTIREMQARYRLVAIISIPNIIRCKPPEAKITTLLAGTLKMVA